MNDARAFEGTSMPDRDWWQALWPNPTAVLRSLGIRNGLSVVDLCCGDGYFTAPLSALTGGRCIALDVDAVMIERARAEVARLRVPSPRWICADAMALADVIEPGVDVVFMANALHGVRNRAALGRQTRRILKSDGRLIIVNWHRRQREETAVLGQPRGPRTELRMTPAQTRAQMGRAGYELHALVELPPHHYAAIFTAAPASASASAPRKAAGLGAHRKMLARSSYISGRNCGR
jgi:SAM-dependent methyltransferase